MDDGEGGVLGWDKAANLGHDLEQGHSSNIRAFTAHVAACDNLESMLFGTIVIVRDEFVE